MPDRDGYKQLFLHDLKRKIVESPEIWGQEAGIVAIGRMTMQPPEWCHDARVRLTRSGFITPTLPASTFTKMDEAWYDAKTSTLSSLEAIAALRSSYVGLGKHLEAFHTHIIGLKSATAQANNLAARSIASNMLSDLFEVANLEGLRGRHRQIGSEAYVYVWNNRDAAGGAQLMLRHAEQMVEAIMERDPIAAEFAAKIRNGIAEPLDVSPKEAA